MSAGPLEDYLAGLAAAERAALENVVALVLQVAPDAQEGRGYGMAALTYHGKPLLGVLATKKHLSVFPFSPAVVAAVAPRLSGFALSKGTIRFSVDRPVPDDVVVDVVRLRMAEIEGR